MKLMGKNTTTDNFELMQAGKHLLGDKFAGVYSSDQRPALSKKKPYAILNTKPASSGGEHWVGLARMPSNGKIMHYDSFGRSHKQLFPSRWEDEAIDTEGFFKTGDVVVRLDNGFYKIVDRIKDMVLVSGFNVYPNEIEHVITSHPDVLECAVVGVVDNRTGEAVKAFVVRRNSDLTETALREFCRTDLTAYKVPKHIEFRDELPKSNVGKILRRELR